MWKPRILDLCLKLRFQDSLRHPERREAPAEAVAGCPGGVECLGQQEAGMANDHFLSPFP
jgi:hypothetical protein